MLRIPDTNNPRHNSPQKDDFDLERCLLELERLTDADEDKHPERTLSAIEGHLLHLLSLTGQDDPSLSDTQKKGQ